MLANISFTESYRLYPEFGSMDHFSIEPSPLQQIMLLTSEGFSLTWTKVIRSTLENVISFFNEVLLWVSLVEIWILSHGLRCHTPLDRNCLPGALRKIHITKLSQWVNMFVTWIYFCFLKASLRELQNLRLPWFIQCNCCS